MNRLLLLLLILLTSVSFPSWALGQIGHQLVCQLSYELLPQDKQQKINQLLESLPKKHKLLINQYTRTDKDQAVSFANSCTWADAIKRDDSYDEFKPWHYLNVEQDQTNVSQATCRKNCVTQAIRFHSEQLKHSTTPFEKAQALMFLGHWVGDIHQPLHVSFAADYGGNKNSVIPATGRCNNLHWYWDECLLYPLNKPKKNFDYPAFKKRLYQQLKQSLSSAPWQEWRNSNVIDWANESLTLVRSAPLQYCSLVSDNCRSNQTKTIEITPSYHQEFQQKLTKRMLQAAVRLSEQLSIIL